MSREIKFRVWDKILNCWSKNTQHFLHSRAKSMLVVLPEQGDRYLFEQYTGLKDRNGVEIFEGDVLKLSFGIPPMTATFKVTWYDDYLGDSTYCGWWFEALGNGQSGPAGSCYQDDIEVVANIHENPELFEDDK